MPREGRDRTLIVTSTNDDRQAINRAIRQSLERRGDLGPSVEVQTLRKSDLTAVELKKASSFTPGQVVEVREDYKRAQLARGSRWTVVEAGREALDHVRVVGASGVAAILAGGGFGQGVLMPARFD